MKTFLLLASSIFAIACNSTTTKSTSTEETSAPDSTIVHQIDTTHTSQNSVDWDGTYQDTSNNTETTIVLSKSGNFNFQKKDIPQQTITNQDSGKIVWIDNGSGILLQGELLNINFKVGENVLISSDKRIKKVQ